MYLDHLRNNTVTAAAAAEPSVTFMDCMEAALYCTEVHSAADAYLIKAEATYMATASEDGEGAAKEGWWAKIKKVFEKMRQVLVGYYQKVVNFIQKTVKPGIQKKIGQLAVRWKQIGMKSKLEKTEGEADASKLEGVKYIDADTNADGSMSKILGSISKKLVESINTDSGENKLNGEEIKKEMPNISDEKGSFWKSASALKRSDVVKMVESITSGNSIKDILSYVNAIEDQIKKVKTKIADEDKKFKAAEKDKKEADAQAAMQKMSALRGWITAVSVFANQLGVVAVKTIVTQADAVNKWLSACNKKAKAKEDKK